MILYLCLGLQLDLHWHRPDHINDDTFVDETMRDDDLDVMIKALAFKLKTHPKILAESHDPQKPTNPSSRKIKK